MNWLPLGLNSQGGLPSRLAGELVSGRGHKASPGYSAASAAGITDTKTFELARVLNATVPGMRA